MKAWKKYALIASVSVLMLGFATWFILRGPKLSAASADEHTLVAHARIDATCESAGMREYWQCTDCNQYFRDEKGLSQVEDDEFAEWVKLPKLQHKSSAKYFSARVEATCDHEGHRAYYLCTQGCGGHYEDAECKKLIPNVLIPQKSHQGVAILAKDATCEGDGYVAHYECSNCHQTFLDADCTIAKGDIVIKGGHQTDAAHFVPFQAPTCLEEGHVAHYACTTCDKVFEDIDCKLEIADASIDKLYHLSSKFTPYQAPTCEANGTQAYWECKNGCGQKFKDMACTRVWTVDTTIPSLGGHDWVSSKDYIAQKSAAERYYQDNEPVYKNAIYYEVCSECGKQRGEKSYFGYARLTNNDTKVTYDVELGDDLGDGKQVILADLFIVDANALVDQDGEWVGVADIKISTAQTYHDAESKYQFTDQNGKVTTVTDMSADVSNRTMTLAVRLDERPQADTVLIWSFDWDGDGAYEQVIKVKIVA